MSTQLMQIGFLGVDEGTDPKALPPGTLLQADNCAMDKGRRLVKRAGTTGLVKTALSGSNIAAGKRLLPNGDDIAVTDGATAWHYVNSLSKWNPIDRPPCWRATKRTLVDSTRSVGAVACDVSGDLLITAYTTQSTSIAYYKVERLSTGAVVVPATQIATYAAAGPRVIVNGTTAYILVATAALIDCYTLNLTTLVLSAATTLIADGTVTPTVFDAVIGTPTAGVATLYLAYEAATGTNRMTIASFTLSTLLGITSVTSLGTGLRAVQLAFCPTAQKVAAIFSSTSSSATKVTTLTTALGSQVGPTSIYAGVSDFVMIAEDDGTNVLAGWTRDDGSATDADRLTTALYSIAAIAIVTASRRITFGMYYVSRPWRTASRWYASAITLVHPYSVTTTDPIAQPSSVVVEIETATSLTGVQDATHPHVATLENYTGWFGPGLVPLSPAVDSDGNVWIPAAYRAREPANYVTPVPVGWSLFRLEASGGDTFRGAVLGASALLAGGAPVWSDGARTMPYGFAHAPQIISVTKTAGGSIVAGDYSYVATYAWRDAHGVLHRSAPSNPKTGTTETTNLSLIVKVATSSVSAKQRTLTAANSATPVFIELWRTTAGGTGPHYRLTLEPLYQVLVNDPRAGDVSITDTKADANIASGSPAVTLASQAQLYTELGELENIPPPSFTTCVTHRGRLVGIGPDQRTLWLSKDSRIDETLAPGFNEALTLEFANDKTALASLDEKLVVFGEDSIDVVFGDGPDDEGANNTWDVHAVQTDVGCGNPRSVVASLMGVLFQDTSSRIMLLDRNLNVSWVGDAITDTLALYPTITSAVLVSEQSEVRFTCDDGANGIVLAWDYRYKVWFVRKYKDASDTNTASVRFVDAAMVDGVYTLLTAGGQVYQETTSHKLDGGTAFVTQDIVLAPISPVPGKTGWGTGNLGWYRVKDLTLLGTSVTPHDLSISFALDYATSYSQTETFLAGSDVTVAGPLEKCRATLAVQKCQAVKIRIQATTPTDPGTYPIGNGDGMILESLALRVGVKDGPAKVGTGQEA